MKKYINYKIVVADEYGNIDYLNKSENYEEARLDYNNQKKINKSRLAIVKLIGITTENIEEVRFEKRTKQVKKSSEFVTKLLDTFKEIEDREKVCNNKLMVINKKHDKLLHEIENLYDSWDDNERLNVLRELNIIRVKRREIKEEYSCLTSMVSILNLNNKESKYIKSLNKIKQKIETKKEYNIKEDSKQIIKTYKCYDGNHEEMIARLKNKYGRVIYDEDSRIVSCYNVVYNNNKKISR